MGDIRSRVKGCESKRQFMSFGISVVDLGIAEVVRAIIQRHVNV